MVASIARAAMKAKEILGYQFDRNRPVWSAETVDTGYLAGILGVSISTGRSGGVPAAVVRLLIMVGFMSVDLAEFEVADLISSSFLPKLLQNSCLKRMSLKTQHVWMDRPSDAPTNL